MPIAISLSRLTTFRRIPGFLIVLTLGSQSAHSTVLEYDSNGKVTVTETQLKPKFIAPTAGSADGAANSKLRILARNVATRYSGSMGVRKVGLSALTFVDVFESLVDQESDFDPNAISKKGAKGLGQLMPETARDLGVSDPFDPESNLIGSARYFTTMLEKFGSLDLALAAYNAGPEQVKRYGGIPPFPETIKYIAAVKSKAGFEEPKLRPVKASAKKLLDKQNEKPLKGEVSVWEF